MLILGFDIGGTKVEATLFEFEKDNYKVMASKRIPTDRHLKYEEIILNLKNLTLSLLKESSKTILDISAMGFGLPGTIHPESGLMLNGNSTIFVGNNIGRDLANALSFEGKVVVENDANCFAYAEAKLGAGKEIKKEFKKQVSIGIILGTGLGLLVNEVNIIKEVSYNHIPYFPTATVEFHKGKLIFGELEGKKQVSIGIILGTGCGGGVITYGNLLRGSHGGAGEIGHSELYTNGHSCYCGHRGCAEQYLSGPALEAHFARRIYSQIEKRPGAKEIFDLFSQKDPIAIAVVNSYLQDLSKFLGNLSNLFAPDYFVLGGGLSLQPAISEFFKENKPLNLFISDEFSPVYQHKLGDSAGVIGAALLAYEAI